MTSTPVLTRIRSALSLAGPIVDFLPLAFAQNMGTQQLARKPEPTDVMDDDRQVEEFDRGVESHLMLSYLATIAIARSCFREDRRPFAALDLACGTGHFTAMIARELGIARTTGIDLSAPMIEMARRHYAAKTPTLHFQEGDMTDLRDIETNSHDLCTMAQAAHHLPSLAAVRQVLTEMDRVTHPDGVVVMVDLVRLRTLAVTRKYVERIAGEYERRGLGRLRLDFENSLLAAWTVSEMREVIPPAIKRRWYHWTPLGFPTLQWVCGIPKFYPKSFLRKQLRLGLPDGFSLPHHLRPEWTALCFALRARLLTCRCLCPPSDRSQ